MTNLNLSYYYGNEAEQYSFYRIPKALSTDPRYRGLSLEAKFLYGLLLDRMGLSVQSGWLDGDGRVYIYYKLEEVMEQIGCGKDKALRLLRELDEIGLIERQRQGLGKPTRIYVKNFVLPVLSGQTPPERPCAPSRPAEVPSASSTSKRPCAPSAPARAYFDTPPARGCTSSHSAPETLHTPPAPDSSRAQRGRETFPSGGQSCGAEREKTEVRTSEIPTSRLLKIRSQDFGFSEVNIMKNNTEKSNTENPSIYPPTPTKAFACRSKERMREEEMERYRERIRENIDYDLLLDEYPYDQETLDGYVDLIAGVCCSRRDYTRVSGEEMPTGVVKSRLLKLEREHIVYVLDSMRENTTLIRNIRAYTLAALYNAPMTMHSYYAARVNHDLYGSAS